MVLFLHFADESYDDLPGLSRTTPFAFSIEEGE